jgi:hypothetical protein
LFPERAQTVIIYPASFWIYNLWRMLKYFLDDYTRKKIYFARSLHEIEKYINKENIPKAMVGDHLFFLLFEN